MPPGLNQTIDRRGVAPPADRRVMLCGLLAAWNLVRIMAGGAAERSVAFQEALRLPQPVCRARNFELIVMTRHSAALDRNAK